MAKTKDLTKLDDGELEALGLELDNNRIANRKKMLDLQKDIEAKKIDANAGADKLILLDEERVQIHADMLAVQAEYDHRFVETVVKVGHTISGAGGIVSDEKVGKIGGK